MGTLPTNTVTLSSPAAATDPAQAELPPEQRIPKVLLDFLNLLWGASTSAVSQDNLLAAAAHAISPTPAPAPHSQADRPAPLTYGRAGRPDPAPPPR